VIVRLTKKDGTPSIKHAVLNSWRSNKWAPVGVNLNEQIHAEELAQKRAEEEAEKAEQQRQLDAAAEALGL
jgi:hypothetical protein